MQKKWNTLRLTMWGAGVGVIFGVFKAYPYLTAGREVLASGLGQIVGSAVGTALLVAIVCGIRNLFVRSN